MTKINISQLRNPKIFEINEILEIVNKKKRKKIGYFIPIQFEDKLKNFLDELKKEEKRKLLKRIAKAQKLDRIEEGSIDDGIK